MAGLHSADTTLKILVIDETPIRLAILEEGLREAGFVDVTTLDSASHLVEQIYKLDPDVILIDLESPSRDVLEQMFQVSRAVRRPIAMFVEQSDKATIEEAIDAGVSAYIVQAKYKVPSRSDGPFSYFGGLLLLAQYHEFRSAVRSLDYGSEFDFYAYMPLRDGFYAQAKYANYQADDFFVDVQKVIFGLGYQY